MNILNAPDRLFCQERPPKGYNSRVWDYLHEFGGSIVRLSRCDDIDCSMCIVYAMVGSADCKRCPVCGAEIPLQAQPEMYYKNLTMCVCGCAFKLCAGTIRGISVPESIADQLKQDGDII